MEGRKMIWKKIKCCVAVVLALLLVINNMTYIRGEAIVSKAVDTNTSESAIGESATIIPENIPVEGTTASNDASAVPEIVDSGTCGADGDNLSWVFTSDGTLKISGTGEMAASAFSLFSKSIIKVEIEEGVTNVGDNAFFACRDLISVDLPDSVTSVGNSAFYNCNSLENINIPKSVTNIGERAFEYCWNLNNITIPEGVTNIENMTFASCWALTNITLPESLINIRSGAFSCCDSLTRINIPKSVTYIANGAFLQCSSLTNITLPKGLKSIENATFEKCSSLASINIPENVTSIGDNAFYQCSSLTSINIPESVTSIGDGAFCHCSGLTSINIPIGITSIGPSTFGWCDSLKDVYYGGNEEDWENIDIAYSNTNLENATIHYDSSLQTGSGDETQDESIYNGNLLFKILTGWDDVNEIASFSNGISYHIDENTDLSFLDILDELIGQKVLVC